MARGKTDFLFPSPSFWSGMGRILDFGGTLVEFNDSLTNQQADRLALRGDWRAIGNDIARVFYRAVKQDLAASPR